MTKTSDTEMMAGVPGSLMMNAPVRTVRHASAIQSGDTGRVATSQAECRRTSAPTAATEATYV
jgi:hypothetical protein